MSSQSARYILVSAFYDGKTKKVGLKFYDTLDDTIKVVFDSTGFLPYCLSKEPREVLDKLKAERNDIVKLVPVKRFDTIQDAETDMTKIVVSDPLAISSKERSAIRDSVETHESDIKTYLSYIYDEGLVPGAYFELDGGQLRPASFKRSDLAERLLTKVMAAPGTRNESKEMFAEWVALFDQPLPSFKILALDIEVWNEAVYRVPDPEKAEMPVIAVSVVGSDGLQEVHVYQKGSVEPDRPNVLMYSTEKALLEMVFRRIESYPILVTFNGDAFDLLYLYNRARALGIKSPFRMKRDEMGLESGVHIDLFKFLSIKAVQTYLFDGKYSEYNLDAVSHAIIGEGKVEIPTKGDMSALTYDQLVDYSLQDSVLTYKIASYRSQMPLKMMILFSRVSMLPMDDVSRHGISAWDKSALVYQLRKRGALIPNAADLAIKGGASTKAIISGKKYQGAIVLKPPDSGVFFGVKVLDFASLYPSVIKNRNLSFESVNCSHSECKSNTIPGTTHWSCTKNPGIASMMIGTLRDLRVSYYKPLSKDRSLPSYERELYATVTQSLKVLVNSAYGIFGFDGFAFYCLPVAEATAALARDAITKTLDECKRVGMKVIYGDSDSVFLDNPADDQVRKVIGWAERELSLDLEVDKSFRFVLFSGRKKNYLGILSEGGPPVIKGLVGKKSNSAPYVSGAFRSIVAEISKIGAPKDIDPTKERIITMVKGYYHRLEDRQVPVKELAIRMRMTRDQSTYTKTTPQHVKAARQLIEAGIPIAEGDSISFVKVKSKIGAVPLEFVAKDDIDYEKYQDLLISTLEQVFGAFGITLTHDMLTGTSLDVFWA